jgi:hypothetical protein
MCGDWWCWGRALDTALRVRCDLVALGSICGGCPPLPFGSVIVVVGWPSKVVCLTTPPHLVVCHRSLACGTLDRVSCPCKGACRRLLGFLLPACAATCWRSQRVCGPHSLPCFLPHAPHRAQFTTSPAGCRTTPPMPQSPSFGSPPRPLLSTTPLSLLVSVCPPPPRPAPATCPVRTTPRSSSCWPKPPSRTAATWCSET